MLGLDLLNLFGHQMGTNISDQVWVCYYSSTRLTKTIFVGISSPLYGVLDSTYLERLVDYSSPTKLHINVVAHSNLALAEITVAQYLLPVLGYMLSPPPATNIYLAHLQHGHYRDQTNRTLRIYQSEGHSITACLRAKIF